MVRAVAVDVVAIDEAHRKLSSAVDSLRLAAVSHRSPSAAELASFLRRIVRQVNDAECSGSSWTPAEWKHALGKIGWDAQRNCSVGRSAPSIATVIDALSALLERTAC